MAKMRTTGAKSNSLLEKINVESWLEKIARRILVFVFLGIMLLVLATASNIAFDRLSVQEMNNGHSSAFHDENTPDPLQLIDEKEMQKISTPEQKFDLPISSGRQVASIGFYYFCKPACEKLWMQPQVISKYDGIKIEIKHPVLDSLQWFSTRDRSFTIYQRHPKVETVSELFSEQLTSKVIVGDVFAVNFSQYKDQFRQLKEVDGLEDAEYIITTLQELGKNGEWTYWRTNIPLEALQLTDKGEARWVLRHERFSQPTDPEIWIARLQY